MKIHRYFNVLLTAMIIILYSCSGPLNEAGNNLEKGFMDPPESAKPRVWWHWMNGNITKEGIRADLEWMSRTGIGGFQNFDASLTTPQIVEKRLIYMTPEWKDAFRFTTRLADSLGLEMAIAGSPGWSESGGPWVIPAQAMKKLVWSEVRIDEGKSFDGIIPNPPATSGVFQNIPAQSRIPEPLPEYYKDIAVLAYRLPASDLSMKELNPRVSSSEGKFSLTDLTDGDLTNNTFLPAARTNNKSWIMFEFAKPLKVQSLTLVSSEQGINYGPGKNRMLEASDDGRQFNPVFEIPGPSNIPRTYTFPAVTAKFFRISFITPELPARPGFIPPPASGSPPPPPPPPPGVRIAEVILHSVARVNRSEDKAGFTSAFGLYDLATLPISAEDAVNKSDIIDLTDKMGSDGRLTWTPAEGRWKIIRFGYSLTGRQNHPASPEATGLEVDKLDAGHVKAYFENYLDQYKDATGGLMGSRGLKYIIIDSWEAGVQNWTDSMLVEFRKHRGYDMLPWMPVLTGQIIESADASEKFLFDFRKTIGDLTAENHYDQLTTILRERGMGRYTESHEGGRAFIGDGMEVKRTADIPMSATWTPGTIDQDENGDVAIRYRADVRESASVAHLYGKEFAAAESMTARGNTWAFSPERLKPTADMELAMGLNRFVIHTSVHQPVNDKIPGLGLGPYGQWFTRHETWAEQAEPWITYLSRSSFMLQQGQFVADVLYFYGEDSNITALFGNKLPDIPESYNYDFINADALVNLLSVREGRLIAPSGMSYSVLILDDNTRNMSLPVLRKIKSLVEEGAIVSGPKPVRSPALNDDPTEFQSIVSELWKTENGENIVGKGKVLSGKTAAGVLSALDIKPDFTYTLPEPDTKVLFVHRKLGKADIYWINNRNNRSEKLEATFRTEGMSPEIWHPVTGKIEQASYSFENGSTKVPLNLDPNDALFVVFRKPTKVASVTLPAKTETPLETISGSWDVSFQPDRGAPAKIKMDNLTSWTENPDPGVKYFSGTGTYTKSFNAPENWFENNTRLYLDLGSVRNIAEVTINGKYLGIVWKKPFRCDVTEVLKSGENSLEIRVTNLWVNRLIGDQQPDATKKYTYTTQAFYQAESPLLPSGLLGPVQIVSLSIK